MGISDEMDIDECDSIAHIRKNGERLVAHPLSSHSFEFSHLAGKFATALKSSD